jgi:YD repeat-containing protein
LIKPGLIKPGLIKPGLIKPGLIKPGERKSVNSDTRPRATNFAKFLCGHFSASAWCVVVILASSLGWAQADFEKGYQAYQSYHGTDFDTVNLANGNLVLNIPLLTYEQRGGLPPVVIAIRSNSTTFQSNPQYSSGPADSKQYEVPSGVLGSPQGQPHVLISPGGLYWKEARVKLGQVQVSRFVAIDDSGATHSLGENIANSTAPYLGNIRYSVDGSDLMLTAATEPLIIDRKGNTGGLIDPNGNVITLRGPCAKPAGSGQFYDPSLAPWEGYAYGTASATEIVDSIGRQIPNPTYVQPVAAYSCIVDTDTAYYPANPQANSSCLSSEVGETYDFPGNGSQVTLTFCYRKIKVQLSLPNALHSTTTVVETWPVLTAAVLPNGTEWRFTYDTFGQVSSVAMPTGATVTYGYDSGNVSGWTATRLACGNPPGEIPVSGSPVWPFSNLMSSRMVTSRTLTVTNPGGGTSTQTWSYSSSIGSGWEGSPDAGTVKVTDPLKNDIVHTFSLIGTPTYGQPVCGPYETKTQYYQGYSTSGTLLKEVDTAYTSPGIDHANPTNFSNYIAIGVLPQQVVTTIAPTSAAPQLREDTYAYDSFGTYQDYKGTTYRFSFGQKQQGTESDWAAGSFTSFSQLPTLTVLRTSLYTNFWQSNGSYYGANLIDLPCLDTMFTGSYGGKQTTCTAPAPPGSQASQTSYFYDENNGSPQGARGNLTTVTRWLAGGAWPSSHTVYDNTGKAPGMPVTKIDPLGNTTLIVYDGSGLYPNKITHPQTGTVLHVEKFQYDDNTGELLEHWDENNQPTEFTYDPMRRPLKTTYADGGSETFTYTDPVPPSNLPLPSYTFSRVLNSSGSTYAETGLADSLGRKYETQITSDSEGDIYADTRYDLLGRVASQSNPYRSASEPTYGVTYFSYDALSRKTMQTQSDGVSLQWWCYMGVKTSSQPNCNAQRAKTGGSASTGSFVDFQDESGNDWQRSSDGLGRLASVMSRTD